MSSWDIRPSWFRSPRQHGKVSLLRCPDKCAASAMMKFLSKYLKILHLKVCLALENGLCHVLHSFITALSILHFPLSLKHKSFPKYLVPLEIFWKYFFFSSNAVQCHSSCLLSPGRIEGCPTGQSWGRAAELNVQGSSPPALPWGVCVTLLSMSAN